MGRRLAARALAFSYYRLIRALLTDATVVDPARPAQSSVTLGELRQDFVSQVDDVDVATSDAPLPSSAPDTEDNNLVESIVSKGAPYRPLSDGDADRILLEELAQLEVEQQRIEDAAEEEIQLALEQLAIENLKRKVDQLNPEDPASKVDQERQKIHDDVGARQSSAQARVSMDGGRSTIWTLAERDKRAIGWVRVSLTGTPCGWCAMLISRGPVYKSERSATLAGGASGYDDGDRFHDNCHCVAVPVFSDDQYGGSQFDLNRQYSELWPKVTRGLSGKAAVSAWRYFIRQETKRAQVARNTTTAQEA
jgi:hypothetical protein